MILPPRFDSQRWAQEHFGETPLGDERRSKRLVKFAGQAADRPAASLPQIGEDWGGVRGIYRLLDRPEASLSSVTQAHREKVREQVGRFLVLSDTTHVDFGWQRTIDDAGPVGPGRSQGFLLHSGLLVDTSSNSLVGLGGQVCHVRDKKKRGKQNDTKRLARWRESQMWTELFEQVGSPPAGSQYIHVCDSAADNFEVFCTAKTLNCDFVIRVGRSHRKVIGPNGQRLPLSRLIGEAPEVGRYELSVPQGNGRKARMATMRVSVSSLQIPRPHHRSPRVRQYNETSIQAWVIAVREIDPPPGQEPLEWTLLTSLPVASFDDAWELIGYYEERWLVEEWHKALKTGCSLESRQLQTLERLLPLTGVLSVVAVLLVQLKHMARSQPSQPAAELVPPLWLKLLQRKGKITNPSSVSNYDFWRGVAKLGGFLGRRNDGEPGWQTIWRGWQRLHLLSEGATLVDNGVRKCG
jgi:hypothetical protein